MKNKIFFLKPFPIYDINGKNNFRMYGYDTDESNIGEMIVLSDNKDTPNIVINSSGSYDDFGFLFRYSKKELKISQNQLPIEIKIINPLNDLNLMFSPNDFSSKKFSNQNGNKKFLIALPNDNSNNIVFGSFFESKNDFLNLLNKYDYSKLNIINLEDGDGCYIDENVINSINANSMIYQISLVDTFQFDFKNIHNLSDGEINFIAQNIISKQSEFIICKYKDNNSMLIDNKYFKIKIIHHLGLEYYKFDSCSFVHMFIYEGEGKIDNFNISKGSILVVKSDQEIMMIGTFKAIVTYINA